MDRQYSMSLQTTRWGLSFYRRSSTYHFVRFKEYEEKPLQEGSKSSKFPSQNLRVVVLFYKWILYLVNISKGLIRNNKVSITDSRTTDTTRRLCVRDGIFLIRVLFLVSNFGCQFRCPSYTAYGVSAYKLHH